MKTLLKTALLGVLLSAAALVHAAGPPTSDHIQSPVQAPHPAHLQAPAKAQAAVGYRSYSYQPQATTGYRSFSYQPQPVAPMYGYSNGYDNDYRWSRGYRGHSYERASNKALGHVD
jgi:hypothetical protein